jgi:hypothetical protein
VWPLGRITRDEREREEEGRWKRAGACGWPCTAAYKTMPKNKPSYLFNLSLSDGNVTISNEIFNHMIF